MRPAMRVPLREALYVCSNCRQGAIPRVSPLAHQFRRNASSDSSNSPSFLERTRRRLWATEKPPGAEDPYTGESQLTQQEVVEDKKDGLAAGETVQEGGLASGSSYVQADTWEGLDVIGFTENKEWFVQGVNEETDLYVRYDADVKVRAVPLAAHQAAVEICLMHMLGKSLTSVCEVATHDPKIQAMLDSCVVLGSEPLSTALRFPDAKTMEALVFVFRQIGGKTDAQIESPEKFIIEEVPEKNIAQGPHHALSLVDSQVKFAFAKRCSQLMGRRIPDKTISSSSTIGEFVTGLSTRLKEKPVPVTKKLSKYKAAGHLPPNLKFSGKRLSKADNDEDLGRKKTIYSELYKRGLIISKDEKKPQALY
ncbi:hypothetical protein N7520_009395 [Penicillium odoratum]|uniref:uncharacterized protein n=1 Tax=Penicillium odoratum TaxID=1167516 RepID=UPI002548F66D|nr:uncharacterized protein N7520_009395 [Penicillium odoratum]KAJ5752478.1 hypothetical protein N7520_009395 [Penicillium odoratum]